MAVGPRGNLVQHTYMTDLQSYLATYLSAKRIPPAVIPLQARASYIANNGLGSIVPVIPTMNPLLFALLTVLLLAVYI